MHTVFVQYLTEALKNELPGMVPPGRELTLKSEHEPDVTHSSVLFLIFPIIDRLYTCLIKRPGSMKHHPGQIGFPGGKVEEADLSPEMAAVREAQEEVGLLPDSYRVIGKLSDLYIQVSNFVIHPYVAWADQKPDFEINHSEVEDIVLFPLHDFMEDEKLAETELDTFSGKLMVPYYPHHGEIVWGGTAMILSEFFDLIRQYQPVRG